MDPRQKVMASYLEALGKSDIEALDGLFSEEAEVDSPLYGIQPARDFFRQLFAITARSTLHLGHFLLATEDQHAAAMHFTYEWELANGGQTQFEVVDLFRFDEAMRITRLTIVYDTHPTRERLAN